MERQLDLDKVRAGQRGLNTMDDAANKDNASELQVPESAESWQEAGKSSPFCCCCMEEGGDNL